MAALHVWTVDYREDYVSVVAGRAPHAERRGVLVVGDDSLASLRQVLEEPGMLVTIQRASYLGLAQHRLQLPDEDRRGPA
jgi:hypothetical protein